MTVFMVAFGLGVLSVAAGLWWNHRDAKRELAAFELMLLRRPKAVGTSVFRRDGVSHRDPSEQPRYSPDAGLGLLALATLTSDSGDCDSGSDSGCSE